jgi:2-polyprenyl-6-methoxyphenol hydroxylase-like FAD-dependent oxidoreductase
MRDEPRILIVGAGIAGLGLAAALARVGITPVVVEVQKASLSRGLALMLTSNVGVALRRLGLDRLVIGHGIVLERIVHTDPSGDVVEVHDLGPANARYAANLGITREALMTALSGAARVQIRYGTTVLAVTGPSAEPEVAFSDGTSARFDLVVGADGIDSAVREIIYPHIEPEYRSFGAWRTVMSSAERDPVFRLSTTQGCFLGSFPVAPNLIYAFLLAHDTEIPVVSRDEHLARLKELSGQFRGNVSPLIQQQDDPARVIFVPVREVQTPSYSRDRVLLIGDAAHALSPLLAQGAAMAIEDSVALAELLGDRGDIDDVPRLYESRRRPRVEAIRAAVRRRTIARGMEGPVTTELLEQHPPVFSASLKVYEELIEDPFAAPYDTA